MPMYDFSSLVSVVVVALETMLSDQHFESSGNAFLFISAVVIGLVILMGGCYLIVRLVQPTLQQMRAHKRRRNILTSNQEAFAQITRPPKPVQQKHGES